MEYKEKALKIIVINGLLWRFLERIGTQGIQFIISIVLARLLMPQDFGTIGLLTVFIAVAGVIVQSGFGVALVQKKDTTDQDYSSVFYLSLFFSIILYMVLFLTAPFVADFYSEPLLVPVLRVMAISLVIGAFASIQNAVLSREMKFRKGFFVSLGGVVTSGTVGITMAYNGYGVWSLVFSQLTGQIASTLILWLTVRWRPRLLFSFDSLNRLFRFGFKLLFSGLLDIVFNNLYPLIIGKLFDRTMLGYYNRGQSLPSLVMGNINGTIAGVIFPALTKWQDDKARVKELLRRMLVTSSFFVFPMMFGLAVIAEPLVKILLTDKWIPCVPFMQLSCITYAFWPIHVGHLQALAALGRSDIFLRLELIKKALFIIMILITFPYGIYAMVAASAVLSFISTFINAWPNRKILNYAYKEQILDIMPSLVLSVVMCFLIIPISFIHLGHGSIMLLQIIMGIVCYFGLAYLFRLECFIYLKDTIAREYLSRLFSKNKFS